MTEVRSAERQPLPGEESWSFPSKSENYVLRCARCSKPETSGVRVLLAIV
jgi:hypothetical protein